MAQVFGGRGTTRGTDGTNPGVKRRRSYPDLKPPFERNSARMLDPSETTESTARIASAGTLQQDNEVVMFEQPDPRPGQLIAAATVPSTCRDSESSHTQDTGAELTGLTTASVAAKGTSLGTITQHCTYQPYFFFHFLSLFSSCSCVLPITETLVKAVCMFQYGANISYMFLTSFFCNLSSLLSLLNGGRLCCQQL